MNNKKPHKKEPLSKKDIAVQLPISIALILIAAFLISQLGLSYATPIRQNVNLSFSQNANETVTLTGDQVSANLGSPTSNTLSYYNEIVANSTGGPYLPMILSQLTATNSNGLPVTVETYTNQTNAELEKPATFNTGNIINVLSATTNHFPYINSFIAQYDSGSMQLTNGLYNSSLSVRILSNSNYQEQLQEPQQIITNVVSPYYFDINQSLTKGATISDQYLGVDLFSPTGQQAVFNMNISSYEFSGIFISNNQYLEGNLSYNHYLSIEGFTSLTLAFISYGVNVKIPYDYVRQLQISSTSSTFSTFNTSSEKLYITSNQGETKAIKGNVNFTAPDIITLRESGYYPNMTSKMELRYYVQANEALVYNNGHYVYTVTQLRYGTEARNWRSLTAGALYSTGIGLLIAPIRKIDKRQ